MKYNTRIFRTVEESGILLKAIIKLLKYKTKEERKTFY